MSRYDPGTVYNCPSHRLRLYRSGNLLLCPIRRHPPAGSQQKAIICPRCEWVSFNPDDIREGYCGHCHDWTGLPTAVLLPRERGAFPRRNSPAACCARCRPLAYSGAALALRHSRRIDTMSRGFS